VDDGEMKEERELLKGNTPTLILSVLQDAPLHGYAIARVIERRSGNALRFKEGTLYPALQGLERDGFIQSAWDTSSAGPARKVYTLTETGGTELTRRTRSWQSFVSAINTVINSTVGDLKVEDAKGRKPDAQPI